MFKGMNLSSMVSSICRTENKYAVYIAFDQFDCDQTESPRWEEFVRQANERFGAEAPNILGAIINEEVLFFNSKDDAMNLYSIMCGDFFYSNEYATIFGFEYGIIDENT